MICVQQQVAARGYLPQHINHGGGNMRTFSPPASPKALPREWAHDAMDPPSPVLPPSKADAKACDGARRCRKCGNDHRAPTTDVALTCRPGQRCPQSASAGIRAGRGRGQGSCCGCARGPTCHRQKEGSRGRLFQRCKFCSLFPRHGTCLPTSMQVCKAAGSGHWMGCHHKAELATRQTLGATAGVQLIPGP
jgi:hypothetical protein